MQNIRLRTLKARRHSPLGAEHTGARCLANKEFAKGEILQLISMLGFHSWTLPLQLCSTARVSSVGGLPSTKLLQEIGSFQKGPWKSSVQLGAWKCGALCISHSLCALPGGCPLSYQISKNFSPLQCFASCLEQLRKAQLLI